MSNRKDHSSIYVDALRREAAGYVSRGLTAELAAVNRELASVGAAEVKAPKVTPAKAVAPAKGGK